MTKPNNYSAWEFDESNFPYEGTVSEKLIFLLKYAALAPSAHNTQPWFYKFKDNTLQLHADNHRHLSVSDPTKRQFFLSLGAALENIVLAADGYGYTAVVSKVLHKGHIANISLSRGAEPTPKHLSAIKRRHTNRFRFHNNPIHESEIRALTKASFGKIKVYPITDPAQIAELAKITGTATRDIMSPKAFRSELAIWIRHNWTQQPDGMPGFVQNIPGPISLLAPYIVPRVKIGKQQAKSDAQLIQSAPLLVVIASPLDNPSDWIDAGRTFENLAVSATVLGLNVGAITAPIENDVAVELIQRNLNITTRPVAFMRFGMAARQGSRSPRRSVSEIVIVD